MSARLIALTQIVDEKLLDAGISDPEGLIAYCARVSNPQNQLNPDHQKLLAYLMQHRHWSPFEMVTAVVEVETTRDIARQILRHSSMAFQEFSQRYADPTQMQFIFRETRLQDSTNRQNSLPNDDPVVDEWWQQSQRKVALLAHGEYASALALGIAKEVARSILPEGMTPSRLYIQGTARSWFHFLEVRTDVSTQKEHREVARECAAVLADRMPTLFNRFLEEPT